MRMQTQFSDSIDLRKLERENRPLLWFGFLAAVLLHAGLAFFMPYRTPQALRTERIESKRIIRADIIEIPARPYDSPPIVRKPGFANRGRRTGEIRRAGPALPGLPGPGVIKRPVPFAAGESPYAFQYEPQQPGMPGPDLDSRFKAPKRFETLEPHRRIVSRNLPLREEALKPEDYIWSKEGQRIGMRHYFRPQHTALLASRADLFPPLELFTVDERFGGWSSAHRQHFGDGGSFDRIAPSLGRGVRR